MESIAADALAATPAAPAEIAPVPVVAAAPTASGAHAITVLYAGMIALQAMDLASTHRALRSPGAYEANPVFGSIGGSLPVQIALKAGATAGIILVTERWKKTNRIGAIVTMVALNSAYATIVAHNYAVAAGQGTR